MSQSTEVMAPVTEDDLRRGGLPDNMKMAPGLAVYFVEPLYQRCKAVALRMSEARGMVGAHLINNPGACMAIISRAITWNLDPFAVAQSTYMVKDKIGYEGKLCQAIIENSGAIDGQLKFEFFGPWDKIIGKFKMTGTVGSGERKPQQLWTDEDEAGVGVRVSAQVIGEATRREEEFFLAEMQPRNSTLWILRPKQQMRYATARAYGSLATPGIFMGIPFDVDPSGMGGEGGMQDITPKSASSEFTRAPERDSHDLGDWTAKVNFANDLKQLADLREGGMAVLPPELHGRFAEVCDSRGRAIAASRGEQKQDPAEPAPQKESDPIKADEGQKADATKEKTKTEPEPAPKEETVFQRGQRLLQGVKQVSPDEGREVAKDLVDVFVTISGELKTKKDKTIWKQTCEARWAELGLPGKMPTAGA